VCVCIPIVTCRHQFAERLILHHIFSLMYPKIQRRQVIMNVLHPGCVRLPRWLPPVPWRRFEDGLASICILIHSCKMPKESETTGLNDGWKWWMRRMSTLLTKSCQRMSRILHRQHWSTASVCCIFTLSNYCILKISAIYRCSVCCIHFWTRHMR